MADAVLEGKTQLEEKAKGEADEAPRAEERPETVAVTQGELA